MTELKIVAKADVTQGVTGLKQVQAELGKTEVASKKFDSAVLSAGKSLNTGLKTGANQATFAMVNLGRVVQDAPFGFIGIANNLNPLLESFQRLKAETGSTGTAIKALGGAMIGAGGLGFAISIISSLLTVFALNNRSAGKSTEEHKEKIDETKKAAEAYSNAVSAASRAVISHQGKLVELNRVLVDTSNNFNILSKNIINQALAEYLATQKEGLIKNILDAKIKEILEAQSAFSKVREYTEGLFSKDPNKKVVAEATADLKNLNNLVNSLGISDLFKGIFELDTIKVKPKKVEVELPKRDYELRLGLSEEEIPLSGITLTPQVLVKPDIKFVDLPGLSQAVLDNIQGLVNAEKIGAILQNSIYDGFSAAADGLAGILSGQKNGFANLFDGLAKTLGNGLKTIGQYLVKTYLLIGVIEKIKFSNPAVGVAVGFALQVLGALVQSKLAKTPAFATGVRNFDGGVALVGERGPELVNLPRGSAVQPNNEVTAFGGGGMVFIPNLTVQGTDLVIAFNRATQQMGRTN